MARILVLEDEWLIAMDHAEALAAGGHQVLGPVARVSQALGAISEAPPDAALLDIRLDGETSFPVADELLRRGIPFAFVTGLVARDLPETYVDVPLVSKPVPPGRLDLLLNRLLEAGPGAGDTGAGT